jgi:hypothetical protein
MPRTRARRVATFGWIMLSALLATVPGCGDDVSPTTAAPENLEFGSVLDPVEFANAAGALPPEALADPPGSLPAPGGSRYLDYLPAIATQGTATTLGSPGTCEAQSFAYGLGSYTAARGADGVSIKWDPANASNAVSAAFQFALAEHDGFATCPKGGHATQYLGRLASFGSPTAADVPYQPSCDYFAGINLGASFADTTRMRIGSFATFNVQKHPDALQLIKQFLFNRQAVAFSGPVYPGYGNPVGPKLTDGYFYNTSSTPSGGHGQLLVGYDDTLGATGQAPGMLLVQNSFGPAWPASSSGSKAPAGRLYWSYETFMRSQLLAAVAYPYDPTPPKGTILASGDAGAPLASVERAYQWAPTGETSAYLILIHHVADPIRILSVTLTEPAPGTVTATGSLGQFLSKGYTYLYRTDGKAFLAGSYRVAIAAQTLAGAAVTYGGNIEVGTPLPATPPAASMAAAASAQKLFDSLGAAPQIAAAP